MTSIRAYLETAYPKATWKYLAYCAFFKSPVILSNEYQDNENENVLTEDAIRFRGFMKTVRRRFNIERHRLNSTVLDPRDTTEFREWLWRYVIA